ncbi:MAG TPA: peptidylprolyl isomerase [Steroidobacteraceae bacterium]|nr:peptidylprolyl isomerase [Steroidobacteraceae bacterium]
MIRRLLREPLLHFFLLGTVLFGVYGWLNRGGASAPTEIFVSRDQVRSFEAQFERVWRRPATPQELQHLVDNWVREEIFYREGLALGLDRDDPVVRRRVGQKVEFIIDGATPAAPTTAELQAWLDAHPASYTIEPVYSLQQVYFDPQRHGASLDRDIAAAQRSLASGKVVIGDATMLPAALEATAQFDVEREFGDAFAAALKDLPVGSWQGPVKSGFGLHLVLLSERSGGTRPQLEQVRAEVERDLLRVRAKEANEAMYDRLRANYRVLVESAGTPADPAG